MKGNRGSPGVGWDRGGGRGGGGGVVMPVARRRGRRFRRRVRREVLGDEEGHVLRVGARGGEQVVGPEGAAADALAGGRPGRPR